MIIRGTICTSRPELFRDLPTWNLLSIRDQLITPRQFGSPLHPLDGAPGIHRAIETRELAE
jgi:hypothetical protein